MIYASHRGTFPPALEFRRERIAEVLEEARQGRQDWPSLDEELDIDPPDDQP
jgi:hypothetical protein